MRFVFFTLFFFLGFAVLKGQIPSNPITTNFTSWVELFPKKVLTAHGISRIHAKYAYKYDREQMQFAKKEIIYLFDDKARLIKMIEKNDYKNRRDSVIDEYYYSTHYLSTQLHKDAQSNTVYKIEREGGAIISSAYLIPKELAWNENLNNKYLLWSDSISVNGDRITFFNRYKKPYKYMIEQRPKKDSVLIVSEYFQGGKINKIQTVKIKDGEVVTSIEEKNFNQFLYNWKKEYFYDENNLLLQEQYFKKGMLSYLRKISYSPEGLPEVDITRDEATTKMTIVQFTYEKSK